MTFKKKSQIQGQVFVYILAIVIIALTLMYGYNAIKGFGDKARRVALITFKTNIEADTKAIMTDVGTVQKKEYDVPSEEVCFIELEMAERCEDSDSPAMICNPDTRVGVDAVVHNPLIRNLWLTSQEQNVFVLPESDITIKTTKITVDGNKDGVEDILQDTPGKPCNENSGLGSQLCHFVCVKTRNGRITLRMEGRGDHTMISEW